MISLLKKKSIFKQKYSRRNVRAESLTRRIDVLIVIIRAIVFVLLGIKYFYSEMKL